MGCAGVKSRSESKRFNEKSIQVIPKFKRTETSVTVKSNHESFSRMNSNPSATCLKIKIIHETHKIISSTLNLSGTQIYMASIEYIPDYNFIKESYFSYVSSLRYFCNLAHECCLENFEISDGIFIMLVSIYAHKNASLVYINKYPFINIPEGLSEETKQIVSSWTGLMEICTELSKNNSWKLSKSIQRLNIFKDALEEDLESSLRPGKVHRAIKICEAAIDTGNELISKIKDTLKASENFFSNIQTHKPLIQEFSKKAVDLEIFSGEKIIHSLFNN
jgi:hypothetical protein